MSVKASEPIAVKIRRFDTGGNPVTGKTVANFTFDAQQWADGAGAPVGFPDSSTITEDANGFYWWRFSAPAAVSWFDVQIGTDNTDVLNVTGFSERTQVREIDDLASLALVPVINAQESIDIGAVSSLLLVAFRQREAVWTLIDSQGNPIDLSGFDNLRFAARDPDGQNIWQSGTGGFKATGFNLTGTAGGVLTLTMPEDTTQATAWPSSASVLRGDVVQAGNLTAIALKGGTTGSTEPTWPTTPGDNITDGGTEWQIQADLYALVKPPIAGANESRAMRFEIVGDAGGDALKSQPIIRSSPLTLSRFEVGGAYN